MLRLYPEYQQEFANDIKHDLTFNMREGYENEVSQIVVTVFAGWLLIAFIEMLLEWPLIKSAI